MKPKVKTKRIAKCKICKSPLRQEIEYMVKRGISKSDVSRKYHTVFAIKEASFYNKLTHHLTNNHPPLIDLTPPTKEEIEERTKNPQDFKEYAEQLLGVGFKMMNVDKVSHGNIIAAKRTLIEEEKVKGELTNQRLLLLKFFRGKEPEFIEGEVIGGHITDSATNTD